MRDLITGLTRTWPDGERKLVRVFEVVMNAAGTAPLAVVAVEEATREGWVIVGCDLSGVAAGEEREIVFVNPSPSVMGAHWEFVREVPA